jgi:protein-disulfide isomerase
MTTLRPVASPDVTDHRLGPIGARVTIIEYGDFECPNCRQANPTLKALLRLHSEQVSLIFRHFPLEAVHPNARMAAEAAEAAGAQGKFWEMHDILLDHQSHLDRIHLRTYAERLELNIPAFETSLDDEVYLQRIREHIESANQCGVRATPTFFINGAMQDASFGLDRLYKAVEVLAKGR